LNSLEEKITAHYGTIYLISFTTFDISRFTLKKISIEKFFYKKTVGRSPSSEASVYR